MLRSMTGYSRKELSFTEGRLIVEIHSVNKKGLEMQFRLPHECNRWELDFRKIIADKIDRGQLSITIFIQLNENSTVKITPNLHLALQIKQAIEQIKDHLMLDGVAIDLSHILREKGVLQVTSETEVSEQLYELVCQAVRLTLDELIEMKGREGTMLAEDLLSRCRNMKEWIEEIRKKAGDVSQRYHQKIIERIGQILQSPVSDLDERLIKEVAVFADKADISEEISRFQYHLEHFSSYIQQGTNERSKGKKLEFILQELNRETHTIGAKSADPTMTDIVIGIKGELEKMREQVQNVE